MKAIDRFMDKVDVPQVALEPDAVVIVRVYVEGGVVQSYDAPRGVKVVVVDGDACEEGPVSRRRL